jgi:hypothetical protein
MNRLLVAAPAVVLLAAVVAAEPAGTAKSAPASKTEGLTPPTPFEFGTGVTPQIKAMSWIEGTWDVSMAYQLPGGRSFKKDTESKIEPMLGGSFYREQITVPAGPTMDNHMVGIRSYDRFRNAYRLVWYDDVITLADVFEGEATEGGFTVTNVKSNTAGTFAGQQSFLRITQKAGASRDEFLVIWDVSPDKGKTWSKSAEYAYKRRK